MSVKKVIIQIPCYNEAEGLKETIEQLPKSIPGVDVIEYLVIDDGSTDNTVAVAQSAGVHHVLSHTKNQGLAKAFMTGIEEAIRLGADIIVNTDADNQYCADDIPLLIDPILTNDAEMVIGTRPIDQIENFSRLKKFLQKLGSLVMRFVSHTTIEDAPSGFRAISRKLAMQLNVVSEYTYTLETIIQAGQKGFAITSVPIRVNPTYRKSRLVKSIPAYVFKSVETMLRIFVMYRPLRFFVILSSFSFAAGFLISVRFLFFYFSGHGDGKIQSLLLATLLMSSSLLLVLIGLIADLISTNRKLLERNQALLFQMQDDLQALKNSKLQGVEKSE